MATENVVLVQRRCSWAGDVFTYTNDPTTSPKSKVLNDGQQSIKLPCPSTKFDQLEENTQAIQFLQLRHSNI